MLPPPSLFAGTNNLFVTTIFCFCWNQTQFCFHRLRFCWNQQYFLLLLSFIFAGTSPNFASTAIDFCWNLFQQSVLCYHQLCLKATPPSPLMLRWQWAASARDTVAVSAAELPWMQHRGKRKNCYGQRPFYCERRQRASAVSVCGEANGQGSASTGRRRSRMSGAPVFFPFLFSPLLFLLHRFLEA